MAELRASRARLVLAADADARAIERDLHTGPQQHLVALAANLQRAAELTDADPVAAGALLEEIDRDMRRALDETARLAQRIYPPLLDMGGLAPALRAAAATARVPASIDVPAGLTCGAESARSVYLCWVEALQGAGQATVAVHKTEDALRFEIAAGGRALSPMELLRDRVEALGGRLTVRAKRDGGVSISGSLPLAR